MSPSPEAEAHVEARVRLAEATARASRAVWRDIDRDNIYPSWVQLLARLLAIVSAGQLAAARSTDVWLNRLLGTADPDRPDASAINPAMFTGVDGAGRPLAGVLMAPMWAALRQVTAGKPIVPAMAQGQALLDAIVRTAVADAGRAADQAGMVARKEITTYVRVTEGGACSRCIILAGIEVGGVSTAFLRHPRCQCGMEPVTRDRRPTPTDPKEIFDAMSAAQRKKTFGEAGAKAIAEGADIAQVVNARRGMKTANVYGRQLRITSEGVTRRGVAGQALKNFEKVPGVRYRVSKSPRLMPEEIYRIADDREHAVRLLRLNSFIL